MALNELDPKEEKKLAKEAKKAKKDEAEPDDGKEKKEKKEKKDKKEKRDKHAEIAPENKTTVVQAAKSNSPMPAPYTATGPIPWHTAQYSATLERFGPVSAISIERVAYVDGLCAGPC